MPSSNGQGPSWLTGSWDPVSTHGTPAYQSLPVSWDPASSGTCPLCGPNNPHPLRLVADTSSPSLRHPLSAGGSSGLHPPSVSPLPGEHTHATGEPDRVRGSLVGSSHPLRDLPNGAHAACCVGTEDDTIGQRHQTPLHPSLHCQTKWMLPCIMPRKPKYWNVKPSVPSCCSCILLLLLTGPLMMSSTECTATAVTERKHPPVRPLMMAGSAEDRHHRLRQRYKQVI